MRLCVRLAVLAALLVALAIGLIALRTDAHQAGNRLHSLFRDKRRLEQECCRLELAIARLKSQERLHEHAADLEDGAADGLDDRDGGAPSGNVPWRPRLTDDTVPGPP
jgi:hypothetical protein